MPTIINFGKVVGSARDKVEAGLRAAGRHELADKVPSADRRVMADIAWLIDRSADAFDESRIWDGVTYAERALEPK